MADAVRHSSRRRASRATLFLSEIAFSSLWYWPPNPYCHENLLSIIFQINIPYGPLHESSRMWTVYILNCADETYYVGCTQNLDERLLRHHNKEVRYTSTRLPITLIHQSVFFDKYKAYSFEIYLKSGSGRAFAKKHFL
jgi:putative endonuclease